GRSIADDIHTGTGSIILLILIGSLRRNHRHVGRRAEAQRRCRVRNNPGTVFWQGSRYDTGKFGLIIAATLWQAVILYANSGFIVVIDHSHSDGSIRTEIGIVQTILNLLVDVDDLPAKNSFSNSEISTTSGKNRDLGRTARDFAANSHRRRYWFLFFFGFGVADNTRLKVRRKKIVSQEHRTHSEECQESQSCQNFRSTSHREEMNMKKMRNMSEKFYNPSLLSVAVAPTSKHRKSLAVLRIFELVPRGI